MTLPYLTYSVEKGGFFMMTINQLRNVSLKHLDSQSIALVYILTELENILELTDELIIYPKRLDKYDNDDLELYIFTQNHQLIIGNHSQDMTTVKTLELKHLDYVQTTITDDYRKLILHFMNGETLTFIPNEDTIAVHQKEFNNQLILISRYLHNSPLS